MRTSAKAIPAAWFCMALWLGPVPAAAQQPIRIGASYSNTGTYAELGQTVHRGRSLCVKQANEKGGLFGRKIELLVEDDQSQVANAVAIY